MSKEENKTAVLSIRVRPSLKAAVERLAKENRRSVAEFVEIVLEDHVNASPLPKAKRAAQIIGGGQR